MDNSLKMLEIAYSALDEKKAEDIRLLKVDEISTLTDYMVIANGSNQSQIRALQDNVEDKLTKAGYEPRGIEGIRSNSWILMDYGDIVINIFSKEDRAFYDLERIWRDAKVIEKENFK